MADTSIIRISKEITNIQRGPDLSLAVAFNEENVRKVKALIIGPPETPYEFGFFEFKVHFTDTYPGTAPKVTAITTNGGRTRFNPNIYAHGKVCLSILGTWRGEPGEEWSSAQGLESILISIQSLLSSNPWENEPGFEEQKNQEDKNQAKLYTAKIHHETLRISILQRLEQYLDLDSSGDQEAPKAKATGLDGSAAAYDASDSDGFDLSNGETGREDPDDSSEPFIDLCKRRFLWYYETYLASIAKVRKEHGSAVKDGAKFRSTPFECGSNGMYGTFNYTQLTKRLESVHVQLNKETQSWALEGQKAVARESPDALGIQNKFNAVVREYKNRGIAVDFELVDGNPYIWQLVLFGKPMTNLDGGVFRTRMSISVRFPHEQPRVKVETPLFHQRVAVDGTLCYFVKRPDDLLSHIEGIIDAIEDESPPYDPRTLVNLEASKLLWGSADEKKLYNRKLRRSAQDSMDF